MVNATKDLIVVLLLGGCSVIPAVAAGEADDAELLYQRECSRCHGPVAQGGKQGEYPRLASLSAGYIEQQLKNFGNGKRWHEYGEAQFEEAGPDQLEAMFGYILYLNRNPPKPPGN